MQLKLSVQFITGIAICYLQYCHAIHVSIRYTSMSLLDFQNVHNMDVPSTQCIDLGKKQNQLKSLFFSYYMTCNFMSVFVNLVLVKLSVSESPEPPRKPSVQISKGQVHLAWENRSPGTSPIIGYYIQARSMGKYCFRVVCFLHQYFYQYHSFREFCHPSFDAYNKNYLVVNFWFF